MTRTSPTSASGSNHRITNAAIGAITTCSLAVAYIPRLTHWATEGPSHCVVRRATGLLCPACGLTRATIALLHLDVQGAFRFNALAFPFVGFLGWQILVVAGYKRRDVVKVKGGRRSSGLVLAALVVFAVARNIA